MQTYTTMRKGILQTSNMHKTIKQNTLHFRQENSSVTYAQTSHEQLQMSCKKYLHIIFTFISIC